MFACVVAAEIPIERASFSELIKSDTAYADADDIVSAEAILWQKYLKAALDDAARKAQHDGRAVSYGDKTMRFSLEKRGTKGANGYPLFIALHGGGGGSSWMNDSQWQHMQVYYRDSVDNGIYIAPRAVTDTWDLHNQAESYSLYDRLIENAIAYEGADPNRVYVLGFSAGGDGVYQITPRMPDRFAAANMSAGHHNWIKFDNLLNTPLLLQVGERDAAYKRNTVTAENFIALNNLASSHGGYIHDLFIHAGAGHNGWYDNDARGGQHTIIKDPVAWLSSGNRAVINKNSNAVHWLKNHQRDRLPRHLIWDLTTRTTRSHTWGAQYVDNASSLKHAKDLFYWLAVDGDAASGRIEAVFDRAQNTIRFSDLTGVSNFRILLHKDMVDFSRPVSVFLGATKIAEAQPAAKLSVMARTLLERGDASLVFHDEMIISLNELSTLADADRFSYCSNARCRMVSALEFKKEKNFPLNVNYTCKHDNHYALTFDDGPSPNFPAVLQILARHDVKATFFVVGDNLLDEQQKKRLVDAHQAGHRNCQSYPHTPIAPDLEHGRNYR